MEQERAGTSRRTAGQTGGTGCSWSRGSGDVRDRLVSGPARGRRRRGGRGGSGPMSAAVGGPPALHTAARMTLSCVCVCEERESFMHFEKVKKDAQLLSSYRSMYVPSL